MRGKLTIGLISVALAGCGGGVAPIGDAGAGFDAETRVDATLLDAARDAFAPIDAGAVDTPDAPPDGGPACVVDRECDDGVNCTRDSCDPVTGCIHAPEDALCETMFCTTVGATCDATLGCTGGSSRDCSDGDPCTFDRCVEGDRRCESAIADSDGDGAPDAVPDALACTMPLDCYVGDPLIHPGAAERCNAMDDDCDGATDEGFECATPGTATCATSCGTTGSYYCDTTTCTFTPCAPPSETCNGRDDDCDGISDNGFACARSSSGPCTTSCGSTGSHDCGSSCTWGFCFPPGESCNGLDDDCDGIPDDGFPCRPGDTGICATSCATTGTRTCTGACAWGSCAPPSETCNGRDDDCDGISDNGFACARSSSGPCTTSCGTTGTHACGSSCTWGSCVPPADVCNGVDDDCDGYIDNGTGCAVDRVCSSGACRAIPASCTGYRYANHAYAICTTDTTWDAARSTCASYGAHLVTVTSPGEQGFLAGLIGGRCWSGLYRGAGCAWQWVTGEPVTFTAWDPGQPSSACGDQDCGDFWYGPSWPWDDYWCSMMARYVCEWDA